MDQQACSFTFNDFFQTIARSFSRVRNDEEFCDVTLVSDDLIPVSAHKLNTAYQLRNNSLTIQSPTFYTPFAPHRHQNPLLSSKGFDYTQLPKTGTHK